MYNYIIYLYIYIFVQKLTSCMLSGDNFPLTTRIITLEVVNKIDNKIHTIKVTNIAVRKTVLGQYQLYENQVLIKL